MLPGRALPFTESYGAGKRRCSRKRASWSRCQSKLSRRRYSLSAQQLSMEDLWRVDKIMPFCLHKAGNRQSLDSRRGERLV